MAFGYGSFFFFSSRRRHTRLTCDWSSDVCSSDLPEASFAGQTTDTPWTAVHVAYFSGRSEERRVGKSVDLGGRRIIKKKKKKQIEKRESKLKNKKKDKKNVDNHNNN